MPKALQKEPLNGTMTHSVIQVAQELKRQLVNPFIGKTFEKMKNNYAQHARFVR